MKRIVNFSLAMVLTFLVSGCEWEESGAEGTWSDSYSWINFSGLYRGVNGTLVRNFASASSTTDGDDTPTVTVVSNENGGVAPASQTALNGMLVNKPGITPGSVSIVLLPGAPGDSSGSATDNGSGVLIGSFNLVGIDPASNFPMEGTINYSTGVWVLNLPAPGLLTPAAIRVSYTYSAEEAASGGGTETELDVAGGPVTTMLVEQVGNRLRFVDSNGNEQQGVLSVVSLAGGDRTGRSSGGVSATYEVKGTISGKSVKITGSFTGAYTAPDTGEGDISGTMDNRILEGIWMQSDGTADVYGVAPEVEVLVDTTE